MLITSDYLSVFLQHRIVQLKTTS